MTSGCLSPHTIIPLPWRERDSIPHQARKRAHLTPHTHTRHKQAQQKGDEARKAQGRGENEPHRHR
eukprot:scaffold15992_cov118-Isochrysis_galbana.AAC.1